MFERMDHDCEKLIVCDQCKLNELDVITGKMFSLRAMWRDDDQDGLVLCEDCIPDYVKMDEG